MRARGIVCASNATMRLVLVYQYYNRYGGVAIRRVAPAVIMAAKQLKQCITCQKKL